MSTFIEYARKALPIPPQSIRSPRFLLHSIGSSIASPLGKRPKAPAVRTERSSFPCTVGSRSDIRRQRAGEGQGACWTSMRAPSHFNSHSTARPPNTNLRERKHGQLALTVPHAATGEETRDARGGVLRIYLEGRLRGLDTSTREPVRALLGDEMARVAAARDTRRSVTLRSLTLSPSSSSERAPCTDY